MNDTVKSGEGDKDDIGTAGRDEKVAAAARKAREALDEQLADLKAADAEGERPVKSPAKE